MSECLCEKLAIIRDGLIESVAVFVLALSYSCRHDDDRAVSVGHILRAWDLLLGERKIHAPLENGPKFGPSRDLRIVPPARDGGKFREAKECLIRRFFLTSIFEDRKGFM
jgi:hypothetical protein